MSSLVTFGSLVVNLSADTSRLKGDMTSGAQTVETSSKRMAKDIADVGAGFDSVTPKIAATTAAVAPLTASTNALAAAERTRAASNATALSENTQLLNIAKSAAEDTAKAYSAIKINPDQFGISDVSFKEIDSKLDRASASWQEKIAFGVGAGFGAGTVAAKSYFEKFEEFVKTKLIIAGVAIAAGVTIAAVSAVYLAYKVATGTIGFIAGLFTGESYKSENIDALVKINSEVKTLQESLQLTAVGASALNEALKLEGLDGSTYASVFNSASVAIRNNSEELDRLGVAYKDQAGNLLPTEQVLRNTAAVLGTYSAGWDRQQAAAAIGMGSEKEIQAVLAVSAEKIQAAKDRLIDYNLIIGEGTQEAAQRYETAMRAFNRESDLTAQGFKRAVADQIMPVLTDLAEFFRDGFPFAVNTFRYSMATITSLLYGLKTVAYMVSESVIGSISAIGSVIGGVAQAGASLVMGDFAGAKDALIRGWTDAKSRLGLIGDNIVEQAKRNAAAMRLAWGADSFGANVQPNATPKSGKPWTPKPKEEEEATAAQVSEYDKLIRAINEKIAIQDLDLRSTGNLSEGEKIAAKFVADLRDNVLDLTDAQKQEVTTALEQLIAVEKANEAKKKAIKIQADLTAQIDKWTNATRADQDLLSEEAALFGKGAEARKIAAAQMKVEADLRTFLAEQKKKEQVLLPDEIALLLLEAEARKKNVAELMGEQQAYAGAEQLRQENRKFSAEAIADERDRAAAVLRIDAEMWRERIEMAGDGTEAQKRLQEQFDQWYANQQNKPSIDRAHKVIGQIDDDFHQGFRDMLNRPESQSVWKTFTKSLGTTLKTSLADALYETFFKRYVIQGVVSLAGMISGPAVAGALSGQAAGAEGGGGGAIGQSLGIISGVKTVWSGITSGFTGILDSLSSSVMEFGNLVGSTTINDFGASIAGVETGTAAGAAGGAAGAALSWIAPAAIGQLVGRAISGGYSAMGGQSGSTAVNAGTIIGAIVGGPIGAGIGAAIGGLVNRAFGMKAKEVQSFGIEGDFGAGGFSGQNFSEWNQKGGWFRSNKHGIDTSALDSTTTDTFSAGLAAIKSSSKQYAEVLGLSADSIDGYSKHIRLALTNDQAENQKLITGVFSGIGDELAGSLLPAFADFAHKGETASAVLQRLAFDYQVVDGLVLSLGKTFSLVGMESIAARERLIDLAGGMDALVSGSAYFFQNFLTDQERFDVVSASVNKQMAALGLSGITTREQLKNVVKGIDLTTESGAKLYAALIRLAPEFAQMTDIGAAAAQSAAQASDAARTAIENARSAVDDAYRQQSSEVGALIKRLQDSSKAYRAFADGLLVGGLSNLSPEAKYEELRRQFDKTYSLALAGDPTAQGNLTGIAQQFLEASQVYFASSEGHGRNIEMVRSALESAASAADVQTSIAQRELSLLDRSVAGILQVNSSVLSVREAIERYFAAGGTRDAVASAGGGAASQVGSDLLSNVAAYGAANGMDSYYVVPGVNDYAAKMEAATGLADRFTQLGETGWTPERAFEQSFGMSPSSWKDIETQFYAGTPIQARALGGYTPPGLTLVGELGPELVNFDRPSQIYTAKQTREMLSGGSGKDLAAAVDRQTEIISGMIGKLVDAVESGQAVSRDDMRSLKQHLAHTVSKVRIAA
jgi:hypothetical protein